MTPDSRQWFLLALAAAFFWLVYRLAPVITPFVISAALAYLGDPVVDRLEKVSIGKWHISRTLAVSIVFILMTGGLFLLFLIVFPLLQKQVEHLVRSVPGALEWFAGTVLPWLQAKLGLTSLSLDTETITHALQAYWKELSSATLSVLGTVSRSGQAVLGWLINLVLIPVVTFYLLRDWDLLVDGIRKLLPRRIESAVIRLSSEINEVLAAFVRGQLIVMFALGVIYTAGLWLLGLDLAFIIGMGAGLLSIVPYLGTMVGLVAAVLAAAFQFQDLFSMAMVLLVFAVGQTLEGMVLTPRLVGDRIGLHPVAVIFAILAGGQLFGFLGILLALPVTAALNVLVRHLRDEYTKSTLYHEDEEC
ncbi:MAG: AI-2E family transporter [Proteobacteria bacterium]|nr:AI-2E family transporter [Pseudomonadota bacterium]